MIIVDGSIGSGGGQILRTALGLSALTQLPFRMANIRKGRCIQGLSEQHLQTVHAMKELCHAEVSGASLHSGEISFIPKKMTQESLLIRIGTAGSVGLVLQSLMIPAVAHDLKIRISGGAIYGKWAVPVDHLRYVLFPLLKRFGYNITILSEHEGFFPKGGAEVGVESQKASLKPIMLTKPVRIKKVHGISVVSSDLLKNKVAERQVLGTHELLKHIPEVVIHSMYVASICPGSGMQLWSEQEYGILGGNSIGAREKKAEEVGKEAAKELLSANGYAVDKYTADQLLPYMAIVGKGELFVEEITDHVTTNAWVIEQFLPVKFELKEHMVRCKKR